jgi:hypothetical protein
VINIIIIIYIMELSCLHKHESKFGLIFFFLNLITLLIRITFYNVTCLTEGRRY